MLLVCFVDFRLLNGVDESSFAAAIVYFIASLKRAKNEINDTFRNKTKNYVA
jgi:hypothetical protein